MFKFRSDLYLIYVVSQACIFVCPHISVLDYRPCSAFHSQYLRYLLTGHGYRLVSRLSLLQNTQRHRFIVPALFTCTKALRTVLVYRMIVSELLTYRAFWSIGYLFQQIPLSSCSLYLQLAQSYEICSL